MRFPFDGNPRVTNKFGAPWSGYLHGKHTGEDVSLKQGTPIKAMATGKVTFAGVDKTGMGYGGVVAILVDGWYLLTAHMSRIDVKAGDTVKEGQVIGLSGGTPGSWGAGLSTGAHLHYEVSNNPSFKAPWSSFRDPRKFINERRESDMTKAEAQGIVKALYKGLFGRAADKGGLANYTAHILAGKYDFTVKDMVGSQEFKNRHVKTKTVTKTVVDTKKVDELTRALAIKDAEIERLKKSGGGSSEDLSYIRAMVDKIWNKLSSIFK